MPTMLLTDEEYTHIKGLITDLTDRVKRASPRAATHYSTVVKLHTKFIAKEDGKRAASKTAAEARDTIEQAKAARRAQTQQQGQAPKPSASRAGQTASPSA